MSFLIGDKCFLHHGITTCAVATVIDYLFFEQHFHRIQGGAYKTNVGSLGVFKKLCFRKEGYYRESVYSEGKFIDAISYAILAKEWSKVTDNYLKFKQKQC